MLRVFLFQYLESQVKYLQSYCLSFNLFTSLFTKKLVYLMNISGKSKLSALTRLENEVRYGKYWVKNIIYHFQKILDAKVLLNQSSILPASSFGSILVFVCRDLSCRKALWFIIHIPKLTMHCIVLRKNGINIFSVSQNTFHTRLLGRWRRQKIRGHKLQRRWYGVGLL